MKAKSYLLLIPALTLLLTTSCKREEPGKDAPGGDNSVNIKIDDLTAPENFNFKTEKDITVKVLVGTTTYKDERVRINIYIDEPSTGKLSVAGITDAKNEFTATMRIPAYQEYVWIEKMDVFGNKDVQKVKANPLTFITFSDQKANDPFIRRASSGITCNTGCTVTYNNHVGNITITSGQTACITGTFSGNITVNTGGIAKVCASGTIDTLTLNGSGRAYILENTIIVLKKSTFSSTSKLFLWSDSVISQTCFNVPNITENHGKLYVHCSITVDATGKLNNFGKLFITNNLVVNGKFTNYDYVSANDDLTVATGATLENYCNLSAKNNFTLSGTLTNTSFLKVVNTTTVSTGATATLQNGALLSTQNLTLNEKINGTGTATSYIKVSNVSTINSNGKVTGKITYCDNNGIEVNTGTITSPAQLACTGYLPTSSCNPEGYGAIIIPDADGDGVADILDDLPNDPLRAFIRYYPCATTCSNIAFEDLWPATGDFDYNDLIMAFNITKVYNAGNKTVDYKIKAVPHAVGAGYDNAFGFMLDNLAPSDVQSVTGQRFSHNYITRNANGTEAGQSKAVIVCFDSPEPLLHRAGGSMFNTIKANPRGYSDTLYITVTFTAVQDDAVVPFTGFNPFMIANHQRGKEIHLPNYKPSDLVNTALFGTQADRSVPSANKYYKNQSGLPWAIVIPEDFIYPTEKTPITDAYYYFDDWAISGGTAYPNWYRNMGIYRNPDKVF